jgi:peptide deformylase
MKLRLFYETDPILRQKAAPVEKVTNKIRRLVEDMFETMHAAKGIGLAANQVGILSRVIILDLRKRGIKPMALINPEIVARAGELENEEGCLSCPGLYAKVKRAACVTVHALDITGDEVAVEATDLHAAALQHEIDHLDGILFLDRLEPTERIRLEQLRAAHHPF